VITKWTWEYFTPVEMESPDKLDSGYDMNQYFMDRLEALRQFMEVPFHINSGFRTQSHNEAVGGGKRSAHMLGRAADIKWDMLDINGKNRMLKKAWELGFTGFGVAQTFLHLDDVSQKDGYMRPGVWDYKSGHSSHVKLISLYPMVGEDGWPIT